VHHGRPNIEPLSVVRPRGAGLVASVVIVTTRLPTSDRPIREPDHCHSLLGIPLRDAAGEAFGRIAKVFQNQAYHFDESEAENRQLLIPVATVGFPIRPFL